MRVKIMISKIIKILLFVFLYSFPCTAASRLTVECGPGEFVLQAEKTRLADILEKIGSTCRIQIKGLEGREEEQITFSSRGETPEEVIRRFLRYIKEENYAFEFSDVNLTKVSVVPKSLGKGSPVSAQQSEKTAEEAFANRVEVKSVIDGTQAQSLGLQPGDIIVEYDGVKIDNPQTLVNEVKQKSDRGTVEMLVVRDRRPMPVTLNAGLIGVRIGSRQIPKSEADNY